MGIEETLDFLSRTELLDLVIGFESVFTRQKESTRQNKEVTCPAMIEVESAHKF